MLLSWKIKGITPDGGEIVVRPEDMRDAGNGTWRGHELLGAEFEVSLELIDDLRSRIGFKNAGGGVTLTELVYPAIERALTCEDSAFFSESQGLMIHEFKQHDAFPFKPGEPDYIFESRFRSMRYAALFRGDDGIFIGMDDPENYSKAAELYRSPDRERFWLDVITPLPLHVSEFVLPYPVIIADFRGGWFEAAQIYKALMPLDRRRLSRKNDRMRDIACWLWNRDHAANVIPPVERLAADSGVPIALDWYWYHKLPYDTGYPDYYPPREGAAAFSTALAHLKNAGIFTHVYVNGFLWDTENANYSCGGEQGAIHDRDGKTISTAFNKYMPHQMAYMCGTAKEFQAKLTGEITRLVECGLEGIYIDMIGAATMQFCYNPAHDHAPGGGNYMAAGYRDFLAELHKKLPDLYLSTEDCNETYMDMVDSVISIMSPSGERYGFLPPFEFVPAFSAVHHGATVMYGSNAHINGIPPYDSLWPQEGKWKTEQDWNAIAPYQFFVEVGRCVMWGQQPMIANLRPEHLDDPKLATRYKFLCDTAKFYFANRDCLFDGEMLSPGKLECAECKVDFVVRYIFTAEGEFKVVSRNMPVILHSVWRSKKGDDALFLLNYTDTEQAYRFLSAEGDMLAGTIQPRTYLCIDL